MTEEFNEHGYTAEEWEEITTLLYDLSQAYLNGKLAGWEDTVKALQGVMTKKLLRRLNFQCEQLKTMAAGIQITVPQEHKRIQYADELHVRRFDYPVQFYRMMNDEIGGSINYLSA